MQHETRRSIERVVSLISGCQAVTVDENVREGVTNVTATAAAEVPPVKCEMVPALLGQLDCVAKFHGFEHESGQTRFFMTIQEGKA